MTAEASKDDIDALAGEYVLGTLDPAGRRDVDLRRREDPALDAAIRRWEDLFSPLAAAIAPIAPTDGLYASIVRRLGIETPSGATAQPVQASAPRLPTAQAPSVDRRQVLRLQRGIRVWKAATVLAGTLAACLLIGIGLRGSAPGGAGENLVAVLQEEAGTPAFLVSVDLRSRLMIVRPIRTAPPADKSYHLWLVSDKFDKVPKSLGLIEGPVTVEHGLTKFDRAVVQNATYAISLEPHGGSPKDVPTGPVLWTGRLVPAIP